MEATDFLSLSKEELAVRIKKLTDQARQHGRTAGTPMGALAGRRADTPCVRPLSVPALRPTMSGAGLMASQKSSSRQRSTMLRW